MLHHVMRALIVTVFVASVAASERGEGTARKISAAGITGTWTGQSSCVGNRPACKDEVVVYRFEPVTSRSTLITLLADKIIKGKRVPMYKLDFQYDESKRTLSCEFMQGQTRGKWEYKVTSDDTIEGTSIVKSVARRVKVRRVREDQMPDAPDRESYGP